MSEGLPKYETTVDDLDSSEKLETVFSEFTSAISREDLFLAAEWYVRERIPGSSVYTFNQMYHGLMGRVIGLTAMHVLGSMLNGLSCELDDRLMAHYGFDADTVPPRLLVREAIALQVRLSTMVSDLEKITQVGRSHLIDAIKLAAGPLPIPEEAYSLTNVEADAVLLK